MHPHMLDIGAELLHWRRIYPHAACFISGFHFDRYVATLKFGYDNYLRHHKKDLADLFPSLRDQYLCRVAASDRINWADAEMMVVAIWKRMQGEESGQHAFTPGMMRLTLVSEGPGGASVQTAGQPASICLDDEQWSAISEMLSSGEVPRIGKNCNRRHFIDAVLWVAYNGQCWSGLPTTHGNSHNIYVHFNRWMKTGMWEPIGDILDYTPHARVFRDLLHNSCRGVAATVQASGTTQKR